MSYCKYTDLVERFGSVEISQLTNQSGPCPAITGMIADAQAEIDVYVGARYQLPITGSVPPVLKRCACELVRYYLWDDKVTDHVRQRYEDAVSILTGISKGTYALPLPTTGNATTGSGGVQIVSTPPVWGRGSMA